MNAIPETETGTETVAVLGPGGVGGLVGALLARAGHRVVCLAGAETAEVLRRDGLSVSSGKYGDFTVSVEAATELTEPVGTCLIAVKETALAPALARVTPEALGFSGLVVPLLNGLEHVAQLREHYPADQVAAATIKVESTRVAPGRIEHTSPFAAIELASQAAPRDRLDRTAKLLQGAGLDVRVRDDEAAMLWDKLAFLAPMALLTTRYGLTVGGVRTERRPELLAVLGEITATAHASGGPVDADRILGMFDRAPAGMKSSMQRDAEAGRPLELDAIGGAVLRAAQQYRIEVPVMSQVVDELRTR
ncbi:ketopantoate reductase family protein [Streptomyces sp. 8N616]|uniref:ketopantoate reductase family protein n=1 Tax=Streptomyces sp. 8N616 TaxID=3457414 RepID=UPI003FD1E855